MADTESSELTTPAGMAGVALGSLAGRGRGRCRGQRGGHARGAEDARGQEDHELTTRLEVFLGLEEPSKDRDVPQEGHLPDDVAVGGGRHTADDEALTLADDHL